jgi:hypothetical protein
VADKHFDYHEIIEYGTFLYERTAELEGASSLVNIAAMRARILARVQAAQREIQNAGLQRIVLRSERGGIAAIVADTVGALQRFHYYLQSVPPELGCDAASFFPGGYRFSTWRKPADVLARVDDAITAFDAPVNAPLPGRTDWLGTITTARTTLAEAMTGKQGSQHATASATSALIEARQAFLRDYNGLARGLVRLALRELGREHEYRRYFRDLQVNESSSAKPEEPEEPALPEEPELPTLPGAPATEPYEG